MKLNDFYRGTTKKFDVNITFNGTAPDITSDTVSVIFKTKKGDETLIEKDADVTTSGATGTAEFHLLPTETDVGHGKYYYQIDWILNTGEEYVIDGGSIEILKRI